jgi:hypothetical protein
MACFLDPNWRGVLKIIMTVCSRQPGRALFASPV